eukprot:sb/3472414/
MFLNMIVVAFFISLGTSLFLSGSWLVTVGLPWFHGEPDAPDLDTMPLWLILYFVWNGLTTWVHHFSDMMKNEYMQVKIKPVERGAVTGIMMLINTLLQMLLSLINFMLPSTKLIYITNFGMSVVIHVLLVVVIVRYRRKQLNQMLIDNAMKGIVNLVYEKVPMLEE